MIFDPHVPRQSKITTQILILHAIKRCALQKTLALELDVPNSRISEWKSGKGNIPTEIALTLINKFGSPTKAKGIYKNNCRLLSSKQSLNDFFNGLVCNQISRLIAGYITHIRCIVAPDRSNDLEASIEDHFISQMLEDEQFLSLSKKLFHEHDVKQRHWSDSDDFLLNSSDLELSHSFQGQYISLLSVLDRYNLRYLLEDKEYEYLHSKNRPSSNELLSFLTYTSVVISDLRSMKNTILSTWLGTMPYRNLPETYGGEVVLTGELVHEWYGNDLYGDPIFSSDSHDPFGCVKLLLKHIFQFKNWTRKYETSMGHSLASLMVEQTPMFNISTGNKGALILIKDIQVFHKEESSYLNMAITVSTHPSINKALKDEDFTLIIEKITTTRLLEDVIPMLHAIGLDHTMSELNTKYMLAKQGLIIPGVISI